MKEGKGHKKKMLSNNFHRLRYEEMRMLAKQFGVANWGCGYMREPYYHTTTNEVIGYCPIKIALGESQKCRRHIPFLIQDCELYRRWLEIRQQGISKLEGI